MFNPHIKFDTSTITCNEEMKGNAECKNFRFEPPFGVSSQVAKNWTGATKNIRDSAN